MRHLRTAANVEDLLPVAPLDRAFTDGRDGATINCYVLVLFARSYEGPRLRSKIGSYGAASAHGLVGQPALEDSAPSDVRVPLASCFVPAMQRATPGTRTVPSFSNTLTFAMALARIRSRASSSTR